MKKKIYVGLCLGLSIMLSGCGDNKVESTGPTLLAENDSTSREENSTKEMETTTKEETTTEDVTTEALTQLSTETTTPKATEPPTQPTTQQTTTQQPTTQQTTQSPTTQPPTETPTVSLLDRFYIAKWPADSEVEVVLQGNSIIAIQGPDYRVPADYVDPNCGDGTKPNPYPMYQWVEGRYRNDVDEVTLGYYSYDLDTTNTQYSEETMRLMYEMLEDVNYQKISNCQSTLIGQYEGVDIYFNCYFLYNQQ